MACVLLVDDEPEMLYTLKEVLRARGYETVTARSAREALELLDGVDAAITDYSMPEMDGLSLLAALRQRGETFPVILLTAQGSERLAVRSRAAGVFRHLTKPFDIDNLSLVVEQAIASQARDGAAHPVAVKPGEDT